MAKYFKARRAKEVKTFLVANGFYLANPKGMTGDDDIYARKGYEYTVKIPSRDNEEIPMGTMFYINKCIVLCGFGRKDILNWWKANGYGE